MPGQSNNNAATPQRQPNTSISSPATRARAQTAVHISVVR
jgi:hypothetical protein